MKKLLLLLFFASSTVRSHADGTLPTDVENYVSKRQGCDHMRGEIPEPHQKARMREVEREIRRLCTGTDKQLNKLRKKYAGDQRAMAALDEFEPDVEAAK
jgi:hypothetical protein